MLSVAVQIDSAFYKSIAGLIVIRQMPVQLRILLTDAGENDLVSSADYETGIFVLQILIDQLQIGLIGKAVRVRGQFFLYGSLAGLGQTVEYLHGISGKQVYLFRETIGFPKGSHLITAEKAECQIDQKHGHQGYGNKCDPQAGLDLHGKESFL
jgi:hypothetical protein